ncbi:MAG: hypothetical protein IT472_03400 [Thermomonas sp.]|uniref:hypothetical protein n=1 Tax=Thermomonas sp. TaxID=1971895 RepID=UPI002632A334|nr:hypothetical protein [Thermomonas sp.]MCC7096209.1 hypothetical protein [Thermomonas sp.]
MTDTASPERSARPDAPIEVFAGLSDHELISRATTNASVVLLGLLSLEQPQAMLAGTAMQWGCTAAITVPVLMLSEVRLRLGQEASTAGVLTAGLVLSALGTFAWAVFIGFLAFAWTDSEHSWDMLLESLRSLDRTELAVGFVVIASAALWQGMQLLRQPGHQAIATREQYLKERAYVLFAFVFAGPLVFALFSALLGWLWRTGPTDAIALILTYAMSEVYPYLDTWISRRERPRQPA